MSNLNIPLSRLHHQALIQPSFQTPHQIVAHLGALQAQDFAGAKWAIGLRLPDATNTTIEAALAAGTIVRTWPMRGTLHIIAAEDIRWMLKLLTPRIIANSGRRHKQLELDETIFNHAADIFTTALQGGRQLTRKELLETLETAGISTAKQRGYHILWWAAQHGLICFGPVQGKQHTFVLLDEWVPESKQLTHEESLAEIARRYFTAHGPATLADFVWWTGLYTADARTALEMVQEQLTSVTMDDQTYWLLPNTPPLTDDSTNVQLLPGFDEYLLGYTDRTAALAPEHIPFIHPGKNGVFRPPLVINGRVAGIWQRKLKKNSVDVEMTPFAPLGKQELAEIETAVERYRHFEEKEAVTWEIN